MQHLTDYQRTHRPTGYIQIKCAETGLDDEGFCIGCGRYITSRRPRRHNPNEYGALGLTAHFADGSTVQVTKSEYLESVLG